MPIFVALATIGGIVAGLIAQVVGPLLGTEYGDPEHVRKLKLKTKLMFESAIDAYQNGRFYNARESFLEVIKLNRWDKAARLYFYLADEFYQKGATDDWNGALNVS